MSAWNKMAMATETATAQVSSRARDGGPRPWMQKKPRGPRTARLGAPGEERAVRSLSDPGGPDHLPMTVRMTPLAHALAPVLPPAPRRFRVPLGVA
jgi:hypothetical protein